MTVISLVTDSGGRGTKEGRGMRDRRRRRKRKMWWGGAGMEGEGTKIRRKIILWTPWAVSGQHLKKNA